MKIFAQLFAIIVEKLSKKLLSQFEQNIMILNTIIDGGSQDDTLKIIKTYNDKITKLVFERDNNI